MMKRSKYILRFLFLSAVMAFVIGGCDVLDTEDKEYVESEKTIAGNWKIIEAYRNDVEITDLMDFSQFSVSFNADNSYTIENYLPFIVSDNGSWDLDDPQYPFKILFTVDGEAETLISDLNFPIVDGTRQIGLTFSPGCHSNQYTYILEEVSN
nr:DUF5004 domain-containing protein [uncultured Draconibacterium sp.]